LIIAEISQNFCNIREAEELIRLAKENGADLAKAQLFDSVEIYGEPTPAELSFNQARRLFDFGREIGIEVFFSVCDIERVKWCEEIGVKRYKISCGTRDKQVLEAVRTTFKPVIISSNNDIFFWKGASWLYCVSEYPAPIEHIKMPYFNFPLWNKWQGFSDHTIGLDASKIALARGAQIIEKHFCIDHKTGVDAEWSMTPDELKELKRFEQICSSCN